MPKIRLPREIREYAECFVKAGFQVFLVGGAVRDSLLGRPVSDYDAATDARPEEVLGIFKRVIPTGIKHGTVTVLWKGRSIETTTFRREQGYSDSRHPDSVEFGASLPEDLKRRDFTINAMAYDPVESRLHDPLGGQEDLRLGLVRAVGEPQERFSEDGLRTLRAIRFACQLGFLVEERTLEAIKSAPDPLAGVSQERLRDELSKILLSLEPSRGLRLMEDTGLLASVLPELLAGRGIEQKGIHVFDVLDHLYAAADLAPPDLVLRLAALLHDTGKPRTRILSPEGTYSFHRHEEVSALMAEKALRRLRFPNEVIDQVCHLISNHMFHYEETWSDAAVRRFLARVGAEHVEKLFALRLADSGAIIGQKPDPWSLSAFRRRLEDLGAKDAALRVKDLAVGGEDLAGIGVPKGPIMGKILTELLETVLDDPGQNQRDKLLKIAAALLERRGLEPKG